jgi:hypothetical protein
MELCIYLFCKSLLIFIDRFTFNIRLSMCSKGLWAAKFEFKSRLGKDLSPLHTDLRVYGVNPASHSEGTAIIQRR